MHVYLLRKVYDKWNKIKITGSKNIKLVKKENCVTINFQDDNTSSIDVTVNSLPTRLFTITMNNTDTIILSELTILASRYSDNICQTVKINSSFKRNGNTIVQIGTNDYLDFKETNLFTISYIISGIYLVININSMYKVSAYATVNVTANNVISIT